MKVGIVGSREFSQLELVSGFVRKLAAKYPDAIVVSGFARGVDRTAEQTAHECDLSVLSYRPYEDMGEFWVRRYEDAVDAGDWSGPFPSYGKAAFDRNRDIVRSCDRLVAFWDGKSKGTRHSIRLAQDAGKPVHIIRAEEPARAATEWIYLSSPRMTVAVEVEVESRLVKTAPPIARKFVGQPVSNLVGWLERQGELVAHPL